MINSKSFFVLPCLILLILASSCNSFSSPSPTPMVTATPTSVPLPTLTPTLTATPTPTSTPTPTPMPTPTQTPTQTPTLTPTLTPAPTSTLTPIPIATTDPILDRQTYSSSGLGFSIAYPGSWHPEEKDTSMTIASPELVASNRTQGAELIVAFGPPKRPEEPLQAEWETAVGAFPEVTFAEPIITTIGGEEAYRAIFSDPRDGSHGWFILLRHRGFTYIIVAQSFLDDAWANYESTFRAMMYTFWFSW